MLNCMANLAAAGLSPTLTKAYTELIKQPSVAPAAFAASINETRTNGYKLLDELVSLGLAEKYEDKKKFRYRAQNPQRLLQLSQQRREEIIAQESVMAPQVENLTHEFFMVSDRPGVRFYQGKERIRDIYFEMLETGQDLYLIRSPHDITFYDKELYIELMKLRTEKGINTYALTPDVPSALHDPLTDRKNNFFRTWIRAEDYDAPVEWNISGNRVAIISYGKEAFATFIESAQIAASLRQLFRLLQKQVT
jgi:predicted transcriptional regulator